MDPVQMQPPAVDQYSAEDLTQKSEPTPKVENSEVSIPQEPKVAAPLVEQVPEQKTIPAGTPEIQSSEKTTEKMVAEATVKKSEIPTTVVKSEGQTQNSEQSEGQSGVSVTEQSISPTTLEPIVDEKQSPEVSNKQQNESSKSQEGQSGSLNEKAEGTTASGSAEKLPLEETQPVAESQAERDSKDPSVSSSEKVEDQTKTTDVAEQVDTASSTDKSEGDSAKKSEQQTQPTEEKSETEKSETEKPTTETVKPPVEPKADQTDQSDTQDKKEPQDAEQQTPTEVPDKQDQKDGADTIKEGQSTETQEDKEESPDTTQTDDKTEPTQDDQNKNPDTAQTTDEGTQTDPAQPTGDTGDQDEQKEPEPKDDPDDDLAGGTTTGGGGGKITEQDLGFCKKNEDCETSTFCCSDFSCIDPSICLHGKKQQQDVCTFGFECMSRCCVDSVCSHFLNCYKKCSLNSECTDESTPCCSQGYCTDAIVCEGNKVLGDTCSHSSECQSDHCNQSNLICMSMPTLQHAGSKGTLWIICVIFSVLFICLIICLRKWWISSGKRSKDETQRFILIGSENSGEQLSKTDREKRKKGDRSGTKDQQQIQYMSESGRPLLFSLDETAYDDAAYLVDRTFDRPYQFTGNIHRQKHRDARFFAVRPVMERESEYNRLNSSHNDSDSQLSFRRGAMDASSDSHSNQDKRLMTTQSLQSIGMNRQGSNASLERISPQKTRVHKRNMTDLSISELSSQQDTQIIFSNDQVDSPSPRHALQTERVLHQSKSAKRARAVDPINIPSGSDLARTNLRNPGGNNTELCLEGVVDQISTRHRTISEPNIGSNENSDHGDATAKQQDDSPRALSDSREESKQDQKL